MIIKMSKNLDVVDVNKKVMNVRARNRAPKFVVVVFGF
jgi:hypothetical protein